MHIFTRLRQFYVLLALFNEGMTDSIRHHELDDGEFDDLFFDLSGIIGTIPDIHASRTEILCLFDLMVWGVDSIFRHKSQSPEEHQRLMRNALEKCISGYDETRYRRVIDGIRQIR